MEVDCCKKTPAISSVENGVHHRSQDPHQKGALITVIFWKHVCQNDTLNKFCAHSRILKFRILGGMLLSLATSKRRTLDSRRIPQVAFVGRSNVGKSTLLTPSKDCLVGGGVLFGDFGVVLRSSCFVQIVITI